MNPKENYSEDIKLVLGEIVDNKNNVKWSDFTLRMMDTIVADKEPDTTTNQLKRKWKTYFTIYTKQLNLGTDKSDDNWHIIENRLSNIQNTVFLQDVNNNAPSLRINTVDSVYKNSDITKSSCSQKSSIKSSSSGSQLSETITAKEKEEILNIYRNLDEEKLWKLSTGKIVEKEMSALVEKSIYEHPSYSFILDPEDENWGDYFTEEELDEIRAHKSKKLPTLPRELVDFLNSVNQMDVNEMHEFISRMYFSPTKDYICHWARKCLLEGIELFMTDFFKGEDLTERDILSRVWGMILLAFDQGKMRIREEIYSNKKRKLSSAEIIERKATSKRTDQSIKFGNYELGTVESSKIDDEYSTEFFIDSMKKAPKSMKDMMIQLIKAVPHKKHDLRTIAIITSKFDVDMLVMDIPENYVFRVQRTETFKYPCVFDMFIKEIRNCLEITWLARMILEETVEHLASPTSHVPIKFKGKKT